MLKERIADGTDKPCITGNVLKDPEAKLNDGESFQTREQPYGSHIKADIDVF